MIPKPSWVVLAHDGTKQQGPGLEVVGNTNDSAGSVVIVRDGQDQSDIVKCGSKREAPLLLGGEQRAVKR